MAALADFLGERQSAALLAAGATDSRRRVPFADVVAAFTVPAVADPAFGLHFAASVKPGTYGALGYAVMSCDTLGEALQLVPRYGQLVLDLGAPSVRIEQQGDEVGLIWEPEAALQPFPWAPEHAGFRALADAILGGWYRYGCWIINQCKAPSRVETRAPVPAEPALWSAFFSAPVTFGAGRYALWFPRDYLGLPLSQADRALHQAMRQEADALLAALTASDWVQQVANTLAQRLPHGEAVLEVVAQRLATSPRTLQRRLTEGGLSFQQVLNDTRRRLAERYLAEPQWSVLDVALLLGYAEQSAFTRAFRAWTGTTPAAWRSARQG